MKEHIKILELHLMHAEGTTHADTFRAAIELMNAVAPLDDAAERTFVECWLDEHAPAPTDDEVLALRAQARAESAVELALLRVDVERWKRSAELFEREAKAARSACQTTADENVQLTAQLSAAQAEIERLKRDLDQINTWADARRADDDMWRARGQKERELLDVTTKLSAAQAEIERLKHERDVMAFERDTHMEANQERIATLHTNGVQSLNKQVSDLETKLTNLRAAAERYHYLANLRESGGELDQEFLAAIEASR